MKNNTLLILSFLFSFSMKAQTSHQVLSASGGDATGTGGSVAYSVGQIVYTTSTGTTGSVAQGVEQAYEISSVGIKETALNISLSVFPNPTSDFLTLKVEDYNNEALSYNLLDQQGKLVLNEQITNQETQVAMSTLARGAYFINIVQANKKIQTFKIIKN
ncbi:MAG: T9SS type A sorting domain-containing protein [Flavobacteriia bacterium]|nr:T9SS type A sorting domain-containing protein [Flavobacteriia bacterium]